MFFRIFIQTMRFLFFIVGTFVFISTAHAEESAEILLHNNDSFPMFSVVKNWTLICEELCSLDLSGPICGPDCPQSAVNSLKGESSEAINRKDNDFFQKHQKELCKTLCDNGLGGNRCDCLLKIIPAASHTTPRKKPDRREICLDFCRFHHFTLRGCSQCPFENKNTNRNRIKPSGIDEDLSEGKPQKSQQVMKNDSPLAPQIITLPTFETFVDLSIQAASTVAPTTPDWSLDRCAKKEQVAYYVIVI
ncbi:CLUMA_CG021373, isoform A [Clunio marinus]|uniref:CLUMA_CG021373, isoform A n=1 Tax=Clunio marinus TaxID=568069 RepID=A0A1J1JA28_9DIPT|nr:CLUMA_CG021373, isoform A [Clunio marinus]